MASKLARKKKSFEVHTSLRMITHQTESDDLQNDSSRSLHNLNIKCIY